MKQVDSTSKKQAIQNS